MIGGERMLTNIREYYMLAIASAIIFTCAWTSVLGQEAAVQKITRQNSINIVLRLPGIEGTAKSSRGNSTTGRRKPPHSESQIQERHHHQR